MSAEEGLGSRGARAALASGEETQGLLCRVLGPQVSLGADIPEGDPDAKRTHTHMSKYLPRGPGYRRQDKPEHEDTGRQGPPPPPAGDAPEAWLSLGRFWAEPLLEPRHLLLTGAWMMV